MTIVLGFACKHTLVFASDSQMSLIGDTFKRWDEPKLSAVRFKNGVQAMVGISGVLDSANYFQDILERTARKVAPKSPEEIADVAEKSMKETRIKFLDFVNDGVMTLDAKQKHLDSLEFSALLGCYWKDKPHLFAGEFYHGRFKASHRPFETIGCGHRIANVILAGCDLQSLNFSEALGLAIYAIERCKKFDDACGGPVQHLMVNEGRGGEPFSFDDWILDVYARAVATLDKTVPPLVIKAISGEVEKVQQQIADEMAAKIKRGVP